MAWKRWGVARLAALIENSSEQTGTCRNVVKSDQIDIDDAAKKAVWLAFPDANRNERAVMALRVMAERGSLRRKTCS